MGKFEIEWTGEAEIRKTDFRQQEKYAKLHSDLLANKEKTPERSRHSVAGDRKFCIRDTPTQHRDSEFRKASSAFQSRVHEYRTNIGPFDCDDDDHDVGDDDVDDNDDCCSCCFVDLIIIEIKSKCTTKVHTALRPDKTSRRTPRSLWKLISKVF